MKKIIYIFIIAASISSVAISCTEETVAPSQSIGEGMGGSAHGDKNGNS